jgi:hypothetical protein
MPLVLADRVKETTTTTGTGTVTLAGAATGYQSFAAIGNANTTYYCIAGQSGSEWEVGLGTYTASGTTLSRTTVFASSNGGALVNFSAGTKDVFCTYSAARSVYEDAVGNVDGYPITGGSINNTPIGATTPNTIAGTNISSATAPTNTVPAVALTGTPNGASGGKVGVLAVGSNFTASDKNIMASFVQSIDDYTQVIVQNPNSGSSASADFIVNNDNTTGAGVYGDFGINSSGFVGSGPFAIPDATYLFSNGGDLVIGTATANAIRFVANNGSSDVATFSSGGILSLATPLAISSGGTGASTGNAALTSLEGFTTTATSGGTTTLSNTSTYKQYFTGTLNQTITLPSTSTLAQGWSFHIVNNGTGTLTVQTSSAVSLGTIPPNVTAMPTALTTSGNTASDWEIGLTDFSTSTGTGAVTLNSSPTINFLGLGSGTASSPPLDFNAGTNTTTPVAGAFEYDGVSFFATGDTTSGRGFLPTTQTFGLTANGANITTIANFFGTNSNISLVATAFYEIEIVMTLLKNTAGTVTWTLTNSAAPTQMVVDYEMSPITGVVAPPGTATMLRGQAINVTAASYTVTTGSITNNVNAFVRFKILLRNGNGTSLQIRATSNAGSITPLAGSRWFCRRIPTANTGSFAA